MVYREKTHLETISKPLNVDAQLRPILKSPTSLKLLIQLGFDALSGVAKNSRQRIQWDVLLKPY